MTATQNAAGISTANDRGVEVRDLIAHLQTLDPYARIVYSADGYTETPACVKDFTRQASGAVELKVPKEFVQEIEKSFKDDIKDLEEEVELLESTVKEKEKKINKLKSAFSSIRRAVSEAFED